MNTVLVMSSHDSLQMSLKSDNLDTFNYQVGPIDFALFLVEGHVWS